MAWSGGTQTISAEFGCFIMTTTKLDANGEYGTAVDLTEYSPFKESGILPKGSDMCMVVDQTSGTTAVVAVELQGSLDEGTTYRNVVDITDCEHAAGTADGMGGCAYNNDMLNATIRYIRVYCTTVGSGNNLNTRVIIRKPLH